jgi:uncharacterized protein DUF4340
MNFKAILVLLLITLGLGSLLYFQRDADEVSSQEKPKFEMILPYSSDDVERVTVVYQDTVYALVRDGLEWEMEAPDKGWGADSMVINHLLRTLCKAPFISSIPFDELDPAAVKLDHPVLIFTAYVSGQDSTRLEFGTLNPTTDNIYILRRDEGRVVLANKLLGAMMTVNGFLVRGKSLTGISPYEAVGIEVESHGRQVFSASRDSVEGFWWIKQGSDNLRADKRKLNLRLGELYRDQVREFYRTGDYSQSETGLNSPQRKMKITAASGETSVITLGKKDAEENYLRWATSSIYPDHLLLIDEWLIERIDLFIADSLENRELVDFFPSEVDFISVSSPLDSLVITAADDTLWSIVTPQQAKAKYLIVGLLLTHMDTVQAIKVLPEGRGRGFESPQARLVLKQGENMLADLVVGDFVGDNVYIRDRTRNLDFLVSSREVTPLNVSFRDVADIPVRHVVE